MMPSPRDRGGEGQGSFVSFSEEKKTEDRAASFSFTSSTSPFPSFPPNPPSPSCSPPRIRVRPYLSISYLLRGEEEVMAPPPPSPKRR